MADWDTNSPGDSDIVSQYPANARAARAAVRTNFGVDHREENDADVGKHEVIQMVSQGAAPTIAAGQVGIWNEGGDLRFRVGAGAPGSIPTSGQLNAPAGTRMLFHQASAPTGWTQATNVNDRVLRVVSGGTGGGTGGSWTISGVTVNGHALTIAQMPAHGHGGQTGTAGGHNHGGNTGSNGGHGHTAGTSDAGAHGHGWRGASGGSSSGWGLNVTFGNMDQNQSFRNNNISTTDGVHAHAVSVNPVGDHQHTIASVSDHWHTVAAQGSGNTHTHGLSADGNWRPSYTDVIVATKN